MSFSSRSLNVPASPIRRLRPYQDKALNMGKKIYQLNIGQPDIETPRLFFEILKSHNEKVLAYGTSTGNMALIDAIADYYDGYGISLDRSDILITNGGSEALNIAVQVTCDPDDELLVPEPFYPAYAAFAASATARLIPITTHAEEGFHLPLGTNLEQLVSPKTRAILLSHPGNPTGIVYRREEIERLADLAIKHDLVIIADEVYREFVYTDDPYTSFGQIKRIQDRLVIVDSVSKRFSACGARIGCLASKNPEFISLALKFCQARGCPPTLEQVGAAALYKTPAEYLKEVNQEYRKRRDTLFAGLKAISGVICSKPEGAFYIMAKLPVDNAEKFIIWMLEDFSINGETVMAAPAEGFYSTPGLGKSEIRMAYVLKNDDLQRAVYLLAKGIEAYPGRMGNPATIPS